jgi:hypothetical protein
LRSYRLTAIRRCEKEAYIEPLLESLPLRSNLNEPDSSRQVSTGCDGAPAADPRLTSRLKPADPGLSWTERATRGATHGSDGEPDPDAPRKLDVERRVEFLPPQDTDLAAVVDAWPELPEAIKAGILAMVKAAARS